MRLQKCGIAEFAEKTKDNPVVCFGASLFIGDMCSFYCQYKLWKNIVAIADNDEAKHGEKFPVMWNLVDIISVDELIDMYKKDKNVVLIIMVTHLRCIEVIKQLNAVLELKDMDCYIYSLFPFCESFPEIPEKILRLKSDKPQIPKIIHYTWVGGKPIPPKNLKWMESWKKYCPEYEIRLWNETNYDVEKNKYMAEAYKAGKYGFVSDYMRLDIIYQHGGIYLDIDVELLKNLDDFLCYQAYFGLSQHAYVNTGHGFGAMRENNLIKEMRDMYDDVSFFQLDGTYNLATCDYYQTEVLRRHGFRGGHNFWAVQNAAIFPTEYFSPMNTGFGIMQITKNCYSIHHFDNSIISSQELERKKENRGVMQALLKGTIDNG